MKLLDRFDVGEQNASRAHAERRRTLRERALEERAALVADRLRGRARAAEQPAVDGVDVRVDEATHEAVARGRQQLALALRGGGEERVHLHQLRWRRRLL